MKKIIALFLTLAMLLSIVGTAGVAAPAASPINVPSVQATITSGGTVTVTGTIDEFDYGYVYYEKNGTGYSSYLTKEEGKFTGTDENVTSDNVTEISLSRSKWTPYDEEDYSQGEYSSKNIHYKYESGTLSVSSASEGTEKRTDTKQTRDYTYYNWENGEYTGKSTDKSEYVYSDGEIVSETWTSKRYDKNDVETSSSESVTTLNDAKDKRTTESSGYYTYYDSDTGIKTQETTEKRTEIRSKTTDGYWESTQRNSTSEYKYYDGKTGEYTGRSVSESETVYSDGDIISETWTNKGYDKNDVETSSGESVTTLNDAKDKRTTESSNYYTYFDSDTGIKTQETTEKSTETQIKTAEGNWERTQRNSTSEYKHYDWETGEYTGRSVSDTETIYSDGEIVSETRTSKGYNKNDILTSTSETEGTKTSHNEATGERTTERTQRYEYFDPDTGTKTQERVEKQKYTYDKNGYTSQEVTSAESKYYDGETGAYTGRGVSSNEWNYSNGQFVGRTTTETRYNSDDAITYSRKEAENQTYNDAKDKETDEDTWSYTYYDSDTGKKTQESTGKRTTNYSLVDNEYGGKSWQTTQQTEESENKNYHWETGEYTGKSVNSTEWTYSGGTLVKTTESSKQYNKDDVQTYGRKAVETTTYNEAKDKRTNERTSDYTYFNSDTGYKTSESTEKRTTTYSLTANANGGKYWETTQEKYDSEYKSYNGQTGEYTGKNVTNTDQIYSNGTVVKETSTSASYNKDDYQTSSGKTVTDTAYNTAKDKRTITTSGEIVRNNEYGVLVVTGETSKKTEQELKDNYWTTTASSSNETRKNKQGTVIYTATSSSDDKGNSSSDTKAYDEFGALSEGSKTTQTEKTTTTERANRYGKSYESYTERDENGRTIKNTYTYYDNYKDGKNVKSSEYSSTPEIQKDEAGNYQRTLTHTTRANYDKFGGYTSFATVDESYSDKDDTITRTTTTVNYVGKPVDAEMRDKVVESRVEYQSAEKHYDYATTTTTYDWDGSVESVRKNAKETTEDKNGNLVTTRTDATFDADGKQITGSVTVESYDEKGRSISKSHYTEENGYERTSETGYDADDNWYQKEETTNADGSSEKYSWAYDKDKKDGYGTRSYYDTDGKLMASYVNDLDLYDKDDYWYGYDDIWMDAEGKTIYSYQRRQDDEGVWSYNYVDGEGNVIGYVDKTDETTKATMTKTPAFDYETFTLTGGWSESIKTPAKTEDSDGNEISYTISESKTYNKDKVLTSESKNDSYGSSFEKNYTGEGKLSYDYEKTYVKDGDAKWTTTYYSNPGNVKSKVEYSPETTRNKDGQTTSVKNVEAWYGLDGELDRSTVNITEYEYNADGEATKTTYTTEYRDSSDKVAVTQTEVYDRTDKNNWKVTYTKADGTVIGYTTYSGFETTKNKATYSSYYSYSGEGTVTRVTPDYNPYTGKVFGTNESVQTWNKDGSSSSESKRIVDGDVKWENTSSSDKDGNSKSTDKYYYNEDNHLSETYTTEYDAKAKKTTKSGTLYRYSGAVRSSWESEEAYDKDKDQTVTNAKYYNSEGNLVYTKESLGETRAYGTVSYGGEHYSTRPLTNTVYKDAKGNEIGYQKYDEAGNYSAKSPETTYSGNLSGSWTESTRSADGKTSSEKRYDKNGVLKYESNETATTSNGAEYWTWTDQAQRTWSAAEDGTGMTQWVSTYYNEDGTQRTRMVTESGRKTGTHFRTQTTTLYDNNNNTVYTYTNSYDLQKDESKGEYKDANGKIIGYDKKENDDGSWSRLQPATMGDYNEEGNWEESTYKKRTGALYGFVEDGEDKDGNRYTIWYDADMKVTSKQIVKKDDDENNVYYYYSDDSDQPTSIQAYEDGSWTTTWYNSKGEVIRSGESSYNFSNSIVSYADEYYNGKGELTYTRVEGVNIGANRDSITVYLDKDGKEIGVEKTDDDGVYTSKTPNTTYANNITGYSEHISDYKNGVEIQRDYDKDNNLIGERYRKTEKTITDEAVTYTTTTKDGKVVEQRVYEKDADNNTVKSISNSYGAYDGRYAGGAVSYPNYGDSRYNAVKHYDENGIMSDYGWSWNENDYSQTETYWPEGTPKEYSWRDQLGETGRHEERYTRTGDYDYWYDSDGNGNYQEWNYWYGDGTLSMYTESKDGVTNITYYDRNGNVSGYDWAIVDGNEPNFYSQDSEVWSATSLLYKKHVESDPDNEGTIETWTDSTGNVKVMNAEGTTVTLTDKTDGWHNAFGEEWYYVTGGQFATGWQNFGGTWYYFDASGKMVTGKVKDGNSTYVMDEEGAYVASGWNQDANGNWQYVENGAMVTGWRQIGGKWYYFDDGWYVNNWAEYDEDLGWKQYTGGDMATGAAAIWNGSWTDQEAWFFNSDGTLDTTSGWKCDGANWYYFFPGGQRAVGWKQINGDWFYFNNKGVMCNGWAGWYYLDETGELVENDWIQERFDDKWYYADQDGKAVTGWKEIDGNWYYFGEDGAMVSDKWLQYGNDWYYQKEDGAMATGWTQAGDEGNWYYFSDGGEMKKGWVQDGNTWYYMGEDGTMVTGTQTIDGRVNIFDENGAWVAYGD